MIAGHQPSEEEQFRAAMQEAFADLLARQLPPDPVDRVLFENVEELYEP